MVSRRVTDREPSESPRKKHRPATTPQGRENQMVSLAVSLAEKQLRDGTASSQVISWYLKLGSSREMLEQERLVNENKLTQAKIEAMASVVRIEDLYKKAIVAMSSYAGREPMELTIDVDDDFDD